MSAYTVLGSSRATLAMLLDALASIGGARVRVARNVESPDPEALPVEGADFAIDVDERWHADFDAATLAASPALMGVYRPGTKAAVREFFAAHHGIGTDRYAALAHRDASVAPSARLAPGAFVGAGAALAPYARLGALVTVNRLSGIGHHTEIGELATIGPGCTVCGRCRLGPSVSLGAGAVVVDGVEIGAGASVGAGAVVTRSLPAGVVAWGVPARIVREADA